MARDCDDFLYLRVGASDGAYAMTAEERLARLEADNGDPPALPPRSVAHRGQSIEGELWSLRTFWADALSDEANFPCLDECDSYGHREDCPQVSLVAAFRCMVEELKKARTK
jgi:hypothetical protein